MSNTTSQSASQSATERADALLTRWGQRLSLTNRQTPPDKTKSGKAVRRAKSQPTGAEAKSSGRGLLGVTARVYVAVAAKTGEIVDPIAKSWQESVNEARREQEQKAAQTQGEPSAGQEGSDEKEGEQTLKKTAGAATEAAGTAAGA